MARPINNVVMMLLGIALLYAKVSVSFATTSYQFEASVEYFISKEKNISANEIAVLSDLPWQSIHPEFINLGSVSDTVWLRIKLPKAEYPKQVKLLEIDNHLIDEVSYYLFSSKMDNKGDLILLKNINVGLLTPLDQRPLSRSEFVFPTELSSENHDVVIFRIQSRYPMILPIQLWDETSFQKRFKYRFLFYGSYAGIVFIMALYNLCIFLYVRDKSYGYYSLFIMLMAGFVLVATGLMMEIVWPNHPHLDLQMGMLFTALGSAVAGLFASGFLQLKNNGPRWHRFFMMMSLVWFFIAIAALIHPASWLLYVIGVAIIPGTTSLLLAGASMWKKGVPAAPFFTIAWVTLVSGTVVYDCYLLGLLPKNLFTEHSLFLGSVAEITVLSLGLAHRIKSLDQDRAEAHAMTKAKSEFLATMSHEIRTPMNGVLGTAQLLKETTLDTQQSRYINIIVNSGQSLLTILNDILDYSKIEAGKVELESVPIDVYDLVYDTATLFSVQAGNKSLYYNIYVDINLPTPILGDPTRLKQVLTNYVSNAFKFTTTGGITIECKLTDDQQQLLCEVNDTGIGIPQEKQASIFEQFTQADSTTTRQYGGTGLGLSISKRFIEMMGGEVGVDSESGKGSTFWLKIPLIFTEESLSLGRKLESDKNNQVEQVLIVTPNQRLFEELEKYLSVVGFQCQHVSQVSIIGETLQECNRVFDKVICDFFCTDFDTHINKTDFLKHSAIANSQWLLLLPSGYSRNSITGLSQFDVEEYPINCKHVVELLSTSSLSRESQTAKMLPQFPSFRTLVVDDNDINTMVMKGLLKKFGIAADTVNSGEEALKKLCTPEAPYDLVFMDCEMPGLNGYQTTEKLREWEKETNQSNHYTICALSAHAISDHKDTCLKAGMNTFLSKPVTVENLQSILEAQQPKLKSA